MPDLPTARLHPRDARDRLAVVTAHARRGARHVPGIVRWIWTFVLAGAPLVWIGSHMLELANPRPRPAEGPPVLRLEGAASDLEVVDVPLGPGRGTIKSLRRKHWPAAADAPAPAIAPPAPR